MTNKQVAEIIANYIFLPNKSEFDDALQIFVEKLCVPSDLVSYSPKDLEKMITYHLDMYDEYLNMRDKMSEHYGGSAHEHLVTR